MSNKSLLLVMLMLFLTSLEVYAEEWEIFDITNSNIPADDVYDVLIAPDNTKWVGTFSGGLASYDDENWQYYYDDYASIRCIAREDNGNIWIGSGNGAAVYDGSNWTEYVYGASGIPYPVVTEITIDENNIKWFGTGFGGIASFNDSTWNVFDTGNSQLPDNIVYTINIDQDNVKWIGTQWGGLSSYNGSEWFSYNTANSGIPSDTVYDIAFDNENNIWMATFGGGIACFDGSSWTVHNVDNSDLPSNFTQEILIDDQGNIWVGTEGGLAKYDGTTWYSYNSANSGLPADNVLSLELDAESKLWIGTYEGGLCCYQECNFGSVTGTVTDADTGDAIENSIITDGYFTLAVTAADGSYGFDKVPGIYEVMCIKEGYNTLTIPDLEILSNEVFTLDINLSPETLSSPAAPTDVTVTPSANGIYQAELNWICPTTTIGGAPLTDLDEMRVYRDGALIFTDSAPTIGGEGFHIDSSMLVYGNYTYGVVGFNDAGEGVTVENTIWVGEDVPAAVDNLVLAQTNPGVLSGILTWDNPTTGFHGGACNNAIGGYHIERNDGALFEVSGSATSFIDDTIPFAGTYCYTVVPYNLVGDGGSAASNFVLIGAAGLLILEDFTGGVPPAGWYTDGLGLANWESSTSNNAGGTGVELMLGWEPPFNGVSRMCTMTLDTSNMTEIALEFKHCVDNYDGGYTLGAATSSDGIIWNDVWTINPTGAVDPETINIDITTADVGSTTFQICFYLNGDSFGINYWYIDDVMLTGAGIPILYPPANLSSEVQDFNDVLLTWDAPAAELDNNHNTRDLNGYKIYRDNAMIEEITNSATLTYTDEALGAAEYNYYVIAVYDEGDSDPSNTATIEVILPAPVNLTATLGFPDVILAWDAPAERGLDSYKVYRDNMIIAEEVTTTGYTDENVLAGTYIYTAKAVYDGDHESDFSNEAEITVTEAGNNLALLVTELQGNYPNPFNPTTVITFALKEAGRVILEVYNIKGEKIRTLINGELESQLHSVVWDGKDNSSKSVSSGVYFYKMKTDKYVSTKKMILMK